MSGEIKQATDKLTETLRYGRSVVTNHNEEIEANAGFETVISKLDDMLNNSSSDEKVGTLYIDATINGGMPLTQCEYLPSQFGLDKFDKIVNNIETGSITLTTNNFGVDSLMAENPNFVGYQHVEVELPMETAHITANGSYTLEDLASSSEIQGFDAIEVQVPVSGAGTTETLHYTDDMYYELGTEITPGMCGVDAFDAVNIDLTILPVHIQRAQWTEDRSKLSVGVDAHTGEGWAGFSAVAVDIPADIITVTENGTYYPEEGHVISEVVTNVQAQEYEKFTSPLMIDDYHVYKCGNIISGFVELAPYEKLWEGALLLEFPDILEYQDISLMGVITSNTHNPIEPFTPNVSGNIIYLSNSSTVEMEQLVRIQFSIITK